MSTDRIGLHQIRVMIPPFDAAGIRAELLFRLSQRLLDVLMALNTDMLAVPCLQLIPDAIGLDGILRHRQSCCYLLIPQP